MKKSIEGKERQVSIKQAKAIYLSVLLLVVAIFGTGAYYLINMNNVNSTVQEQSYLTDTTDTDGDGYLDSVDSDPQNWNVGDRDLLMFATLAYEPAQGTAYVDNGSGSWEKRTIDYVCKESATEDCKDNIDNATGKNLGYMIDENHMVGMKARSYNILGGIVFKGWQVVGKDYYFAGEDESGNTEYYASIDEVKNWAIVDYVSRSVLDKDNDGEREDGGIPEARFEATTFRLDNNIVIAYRGTDFPDMLEWTADLLGYGIGNSLGNYEKEAAAYARKIVDIYTKEYKDGKMTKEPNFYITGHSLGGYLAQIGAIEIIQNDMEGKDYLRDVVYFNGMGLNLNSGVRTNKWSEEYARSEERYIKLQKWADGEENKPKHRVICYHINGDIISALGVHVNKVGFYTAPGAVRRHLAVSTIGQNLTRNTFFKELTSLLFKGTHNLTTTTLAQVNKYFDYYNNIYGEGKTISVMDLMWFTHEPSASLFYNIKQGTRGGSDRVNVTTVVGQKTLNSLPITLTAESTGEPISYQWYKNNVAIGGAINSTYTLQRDLKAKSFNDKYTVEVNVPGDKMTGIANIDTITPRVTFYSEAKWVVKNKKQTVIKLTIHDENGFLDNYITKDDISFSGSEAVKILKLLSVSNKTDPTGDGKTVEWYITVKGNFPGLKMIILKEGAIMDGYGNKNTKTMSKMVKVTLL